VAKPGSLYDWYRGNPRQQGIVEAFGELEPIRPEYRDRTARLKVMDDQGVDGTLLFPTLGVGIEEALRHRGRGQPQRGERGVVDPRPAAPAGIAADDVVKIARTNALDLLALP
jgi:hypothetical protein